MRKGKERADGGIRRRMERKRRPRLKWTAREKGLSTREEEEEESEVEEKEEREKGWVNVGLPKVDEEDEGRIRLKIAVRG